MLNEIFVLRHDVIDVDAIGNAQHQVILKVIVMILEHKGVEDLVCTDRRDEGELAHLPNACPGRFVRRRNGVIAQRTILPSALPLNRRRDKIRDIFDRKRRGKQGNLLRDIGNLE